MKRQKKIPIVEPRKVFAQGNSAYISIPPEWFRAHGIEMPRKGRPIELLVVADSDIRIVNPKKYSDVYKTINQIVAEAPEIRDEEKKHVEVKQNE